MSDRTLAAVLKLDPAATEQALVQFIKHSVLGNGFERVVLGLSGGADSAVTAALCSRALGSENVHAYMLPYRTSSDSSRNDAEEVARALGIIAEVVDVSPMADAYFEGRDLSRLRKGNVLARLRMMVLFDLAAKRTALVAGTSNKTETYLGYSTWYGDSACSFQPIADLYKSQLWQLARWLELPESVIAKAPSADLWPGQTDEEELGLEYVVADEILHGLLDRGQTLEELVQQGAQAETISKIIRIIRKTQYKRQMPEVARLTPSPVRTDHILSPDPGPNPSL